MSKKKAVLLLSGGVDSFVCGQLLKADGYDLSGIYIDFGQKSAKAEKAAAAKVAEYLGFEIETITLKPDQNCGTGEIYGRNAFLILTALLVDARKSNLIAIGVHSGTTYYDCSAEFITAIDAIVRQSANGEVAIVAPLLDWVKGDIYAYFKKSKLPADITYSCEEGALPPCGQCASCKDRENF